MGAGRKTQTFILNGTGPPASNPVSGSTYARNLRKNDLGGVIFGCKNTTIKECLFKQLFGLPGQHFSYVKNIEPGLPLFLFNYSDRKLHGIFEAASVGQMNINPYGWTTDGKERTQYPAQVQIRIRLQCQPLPEDQFRSIIIDNYYNKNHFWFELDHAQTSKLMSLLASLAVAPSACVPQSTVKWRTIFRALPSSDAREEDDGTRALVFESENSSQSSRKSDSTEGSTWLDGDKKSLEANLDVNVAQQQEKDLVYMKLKELSLNREYQEFPVLGYAQDTIVGNGKNRKRQEFPVLDYVQDTIIGNDKNREHQEFPVLGYVQDTIVGNDKNLVDNGSGGAQFRVQEKNEESLKSLSDNQESIIAQLVKEMEELKAFKAEQTQKVANLEQKLAEAEIEIRQLKDRCVMGEPASNPPVHVDDMLTESSNELQLDPTESIFLVGGYDGESWSSALDSYFPSQDVIKSFMPMNSVRSYASVTQLNGELYVFGGGDGYTWFNTVESYRPSTDQWTLCPSLKEKKGSLAGATVNDKLFAIGGGNGVDCFADVEMLDLDIGSWISTRSMLQKRFALAAAELNGAIYATGGFDGNDYLNSAERFDPREHSWAKIACMNSKRGCHSLVVLNEKLYAVAGFDGNTMVPSMEVFDPRLGTWVNGESMNLARGYSAAAVLNESIYIIGGVKIGDAIIETVECYKEGEGWKEINSKAIGKRCFLSAIVL